MLYGPIRSVQPSHNYCDDVVKCYTFIYVLCNPAGILANRYTFLYVLYTFRIHPPYKRERILYTFLVPSTFLVRSYTFLLRSFYAPSTPLVPYLPASAYTWPHVAISITFLYVPVYVPIRSGRPCALTTRSPYVPYTFSCVPYTFLQRSSYVPSTILPLARFCPHLASCGHLCYVPIRSGIRSYTFRAASSLHPPLATHPMKSVYAPMRSVTFPYNAIAMRFLYVPYTFLHVALELASFFQHHLSASLLPGCHSAG